jgi:hypothetical protein
MARQDDTTDEDSLYVYLLEEADPIEPFFQTYWAHAEHLGEALHKVIVAATRNGLSLPLARAADSCEIPNSDWEVARNPEADVFWTVGRIFFPPEPSFRVPYGVISSYAKGDHDLDEIRAGFERSADETGLHTIEVNVPESGLLGTYSHLLSLRSRFKVFWYKIHGHWTDSDQDELYVNESLDSPEKIITHLRKTEINSVKNGFLTLTAYIEEGATNFNISDHKKIVVLTYSENVADQVVAELERNGLGRIDPFVSIELGIHHWHYRHPESKPRDQLIQSLLESGFRKWAPKA